MKELRANGTVLIAGATGFIGSHLLQPGNRALVRNASSLPDKVSGDLLDPASLRVACTGCETVFHCAGYAHAFTSSDPNIHWRINFEGTRNLVEAAGQAGVRRFVFLSSVKAMAEPGNECVDENWCGEPVTSYGRAKRAAEQAVLEAGTKYGMHVVNLRLAMVYGTGGRGNLERMVRGIRAGWFPPLPETGNMRSLVHVNDVVEVMRLAAEHPAANGRTYIVAEPQAYSGREICDTIRSVLGKGPATLRIPAFVFRAAGRIGDGVSALLHRQLPISSEVVDRLLSSAGYSPALIERELCWRAKVRLAEGIKKMLADGGRDAKIA
ncbi:MAG: NAD-dependent epimerase/dehydratase family protein [Rhodocyclaceae bacterium]|nr:NAD-dependent epimerase/dehydratase family protein [Rhodocyclaceae bacterium]